jgi:hypothetical protein
MIQSQLVGAEVTTVMMRNLPNKYTQQMLSDARAISHTGFQVGFSPNLALQSGFFGYFPNCPKYKETKSHIKRPFKPSSAP